MNVDASASPKTEELLPRDGCDGTLVGRAWNPQQNGPSPVTVREGDVYDISRSFPTMWHLTEHSDPAAAVASTEGDLLGSLAVLARNSGPDRDAQRPSLLSPADLHTLKAAGVTFAVSMIERIIEERVRGDADAARGMREEILGEIGTDLGSIRPGTEEAAALKSYLVGHGLWSQYLEVGIGPDAEIFTKGPTMSSVGPYATVGVLAASKWNNPEPEVAVVIASDGRIVGSTLGNDVNLRDIEGRSALLLGRAKDNNASCALGPFIRLFDNTFGLETVRELTVTLQIDGLDGFRLEGTSHMSQISRDPADLVRQLIGPHHQYPDGAVLMLGTMFAPTQDRGFPGQGFTHHEQDVVRISAPELGTLSNRVSTSEGCEPWVLGVGALMTNLAGRGLL